MNKFLPVLFTIILLFPLALIAQQTEQTEDPFKRDPIFNKSLEELLGMKSESESDSTGIEPQRRFRSFQQEGIDFDGALEAGPYNTNPLYNQFPNLPMIHYNRVDGLFLGLKKERMQWYDYGDWFDLNRFRVHGLIGYGTASTRWDYAIGLERFVGRQNRILVGAELHRATATEDYWRVGLIESTFTSLFAAYDFPDYHLKDGFGVYTAVRGKRWFEGAFSYNNDDFSSLSVGTTYSFFGKRSTFRPNQPIDLSTDETNIQRLNVALSFNPKRLILTRYFSMSAMAELELADNSGFDNEFSYSSYLAELNLFSNFEPGSVLKWRLRAGSITGNAPLFKQLQLGGIGSLRGSPYKVFTGNQMLLSNVELQFGSSISGGNEWIDFDSFYTTFFLDSGFARQSNLLEDSTNPFDDIDGFKLSDLQHDIGVGLGSDLIRAELAWPLKRFGSTPVFWIRFNPTF
ncbi:hypothetical protein [Rhodohalobacter sp. 8-1]|uniref:hypothetical protein n=1 Tax=Rhodohalobacter sp. 8-1 TaxID=3131972 RepID=UPI0030ECC9BC